MPRVTIICPNCNYSRDVDDAAIPAGVTRATCPKCRQRFGLSEAISPSAVVPPPQPLAEAVPPPFEPPTAVPTPNILSKPRPQTLCFSFSGNARDYFGIWIVNTLLKIVTVGIYSAWAKVRKRRYFYGNTMLNNTGFEYLADPMALFKGWLIAAAFFILYSVGTKVNPTLASILGLVFFIAMPWLIVRSRVFNLRNSSHRNIRFTFQPDYREAYVVFAGLPFLIPFTLGLIVPYMVYRQKKFFVEQSGYGRTRCTFDATVKEVYMVFLKAAGGFALLIAGLILTAYFLSATLRELSPLFLDGSGLDKKTQQKGVVAAIFIVFAVLNLFYLFFAVYVQTALRNLTWNGTRLMNSRFYSTLRVRDMAWLYSSSAAAIFLSLGLLIPWASIRITRYQLKNLSLKLNDDIEGFRGWGHTGVGSAGEEIGDMFGIDVGL
jgi:uncharacterized membrane protein YjgN (DUF898 family)